MMLTIVLASFFLLAAGDSKPRVYQPAKELIKDIKSGKIHNNDNSRIIGGETVRIEDHPWQVSLQHPAYSGHFCGGSILDNSNILTAAHCVESFSPTWPSDLKILAGHSSRDSGEVRAVSGITVHRRYSGSLAGYPNDIAILHLSSPLELNGDTIQAVTLPSSSEEFTGNQECWMTGWGRHSSGQNLPENLQGANISPITNAYCSSLMSSVGGAIIHDTHICPSNGTMGSCNGDSGGPYVCKVNGTPVLAGVTSWGIQSNGACRTDYPSVYVRVSKYLNWINNNKI